MAVRAPGHILKSATDRIKVDKRDAIRLARLLSAGELHEVRVPAPDEEQSARTGTDPATLHTA